MIAMKDLVAHVASQETPGTSIAAFIAGIKEAVKSIVSKADIATLAQDMENNMTPLSEAVAHKPNIAGHPAPIGVEPPLPPGAAPTAPPEDELVEPPPDMSAVNAALEKQLEPIEEQIKAIIEILGHVYHAPDEIHADAPAEPANAPV